VSNRAPISTTASATDNKDNSKASGRPTKLVTADKLITYTYGIHGQVLFKTLTQPKMVNP